MAGFSFPKSLATSGLAGDPKFFTFEDVTTPGVDQDLIEETIPAGKKWNIIQCIVVCRYNTKIRILQNGIIIGSMRTGPGESQVLFPWFPTKQGITGDIIKVVAITPIGSAVVDIEAYLQVTEQNN